MTVASAHSERSITQHLLTSANRAGYQWMRAGQIARSASVLSSRAPSAPRARIAMAVDATVALLSIAGAWQDLDQVLAGGSKRQLDDFHRACPAKLRPQTATAAPGWVVVPSGRAREATMRRSTSDRCIQRCSFGPSPDCHAPPGAG
jgi:hypothetical protein